MRFTIGIGQKSVEHIRDLISHHEVIANLSVLLKDDSLLSQDMNLPKKPLADES